MRVTTDKICENTKCSLSSLIEILIVKSNQNIQESGGRNNPNTVVNRSRPHGRENHNGTSGGNLLQYKRGIKRARIIKIQLLYVVIRIIRFVRYVPISNFTYDNKRPIMGYFFKRV